MMTAEERARQFVTTGFRALGVPSLGPYIKIFAELIRGAESDALETAAKIADSHAIVPREFHFDGQDTAREIARAIRSAKGKGE